MKNKWYKIISCLLTISLILGLICHFTKNKYEEQDRYKNKLELFFDRLSLNPNKYPQWIFKPDINLLIEELKKSKNYLEFGSGGSTFAALLNSNADIVSVESDPDWLDYMRKWRLIRRNEGKRLILYYVNIGKIAGSGYPKDEKRKGFFPYYSKNVFRYYPRDYDLVLIDGRFRVACALQTILNTSDDVVILWHDFTNRPYYHEILRFLEIQNTVGTMVLLKKKKNINEEEVKELFDKYKFDQR